jgi:hypothetical protein
MTAALGLSLVLGLLSQAKEPAVDTKDDDAPARLAYMKDSVTPYSVRPIESGAAPFKLQPEPMFRLNNAVSGVKDGAIFLWTGDLGRPEAAIQVFRIPNGWWLHEFTSLSTGPFVTRAGSTVAWRPSRPGLEFKPVPEAPKPGATPEQRLRQMSAMARDFSADDNFESKAWNTLRLLPRPLLRYGKAGAKVEDGALFGFVLGTDPEVFLMLEARPGKDGLEWQYALAPMTCYQVKGSWKGKEVWALPLRLPADDPAGTFYDTVYSKGSEADSRSPGGPK